MDRLDDLMNLWNDVTYNDWNLDDVEFDPYDFSDVDPEED